MLKGFVPAINKISVLGTLSSSNSQELTENVLKNWSFYQQKLMPDLQTTSKQLSSEVSVLNKKVQQQITESYEPFQDSLTFLPMKMPILLPSGHHVDQSSLEKLISSQQHLGLAPRDPFTGIVFTEKYEPVLDVRLKVEIDRKHLKRNSSGEIDNISISNKKMKSEISLNCAKCKCCLDFSAPTYKLSCGHKICGNCSHHVKDNTHKCYKCGVKYNRFDITRSHGIVQ